MKIKFQNYIPDEDPEWVCVAFRYGKDRPWHIYESSSYAVPDWERDVHEIIKEVMEEKRVSRRNIKIVRPKYVMFDEVPL